MSILFGGKKAELGRSSWYLLHAAAKTIDNIEDFRDFARDFINVYPCKQCRNHVRSQCSSILNELQTLGGDTDLHTIKELTVAWAARLHACVTLHLKDDPDAVVSEKSYDIALRIQDAKGNVKLINNLLTSR